MLLIGVIHPSHNEKRNKVMKREGIRRRQKVFFTFLLAVIIGILPTVEVLAEDYAVTVAKDGANQYTYKYSVNGGASIDWVTDTTTSDVTHQLPGVSIGVEETITFDTTNTNLDAVGDFEYQNNNGGVLGNPSNTCYDTTTIAGKTKITIEDIGGKSPWNVFIVCGSGGVIDTVVFKESTPPAPPVRPTPSDPEPEPDPYKITYYPDNVLNFPIEDETYDLEIGLPKNTFRANPGQMFEGWQVADTEQDPVVGTGEIYKPGTVFKVKDGMAFIAVWKDNPTFKIESDEEYFLTPPENTINKLTSLIRMSSEITYYEDGEEPEEGDTEKEKKTYIKGTAIPSSQLEVVIEDPKAIRKVGTFPAKIVYKGLYNRTIEKTVSVTVLDPNAPTYDSFSITDVTKVGTVVIDYPSSIAYHGDKWDKAKSLVKVTDETTKVIKKKVKNTDLTGLKPGDSGKFTMITVKVKENKKIGINKKESGKLTKKVNHRIKDEMKKNPKKITIRSLIVMPELINNVSAIGDKLKSVSLVLDDKTMVTIKEDSFTVDEANQVVNFTGNYGGNLTFEELGLSPVPSPSSVPVPSNVPTNN